MNPPGVRILALVPLLFVAITSLGAQEPAKKVPVAPILRELVKRSTLAEPDGQPFYLRAKIVNEKDASWDYNSEAEVYWASPTKWRRTIHSKGFSQVLIVNGDQRFEQNTGDYFPPDVEKEIQSLIDPIPPNVIQTFEKLSMEITPPDGKSGQCLADQYFNDDQGERARITVALNSQTGLLSYIWFPGWDVGDFADYRPFHNKMIAWKTKENPVNSQIEELRESEYPDESLFAIAQATPPAGRIQTVLVNGSEFKTQVSKAPDLNWPTVSALPTSGTVNIDIVTDRQGHVREARSYLASNRELKDWAAAQVKGWEFAPHLVDGVAVQVAATFDIDFKTSLKPGVSDIPATSYFEQARQLSVFRFEGAPAFHLKASFVASGNAEITGSGIYEETWVSPKRWRREATLAGHQVVETQNGDLRYRKIDQAYSPRRIDDAFEALGTGLPFDNGKSFGPSWQVSKAQLGNVVLLQVLRGNMSADGKPAPNAQAYYFEPDGGLLRARQQRYVSTAYNNFADFSGKQVARHLSVVESGIRILDITIEQLETASPANADIFSLAGVTPISFATTDTAKKIVNPVVLKQVAPASTPELREQGFHGKIVSQLLVDAHGHVREVILPENTNPIIGNAIRDAALQWEFTPGTFNGRPGEYMYSAVFQFN